MNIAWNILPPSGKGDSSNRRFVFQLFVAVHGLKLEIGKLKLGSDETSLRVGCLKTDRRVITVYGLKLEIGKIGPN